MVYVDRSWKNRKFCEYNIVVKIKPEWLPFAMRRVPLAFGLKTTCHWSCEHEIWEIYTIDKKHAHLLSCTFLSLCNAAVRSMSMMRDVDFVSHKVNANKICPYVTSSSKIKIKQQ